MPKDTKAEALGSVAAMFELVAACVAYENCYRLLRRHWKFTQGPEWSRERAWEGGPDALGDVSPATIT